MGSLDVSRFIIGSNPVSGFSHQSGEMDSRMKHYFSTGRIKRLLRDGEGLGINTVIARADHHIMRVLMEYWDDGGKLQWIAQTCPELGSIDAGVRNAIVGGAKACFVHGGVMDHLHAVLDTKLHGACAAGMGCNTFVVHARHLAYRIDFRFGHHRLMRLAVGKRVA